LHIGKDVGSDADFSYAIPGKIENLTVAIKSGESGAGGRALQ